MGSFFKIIFSEFWSMVIRPLAIMLLSKGAKDLWDTTNLAVSGVEADMPDAPGKEKWEEAYRRITEDLQAKGKDYPTWVKNLFIELVVGWIKNYIPFNF